MPFKYPEPVRTKDGADRKEPSARILPLLCHDSRNNLFLLAGYHRSALEAWKYDISAGTWTLLKDNVDVDKEGTLSSYSGSCAVSPPTSITGGNCLEPRIVHFSGDTELSLLELRCPGISTTTTSGGVELRFHNRLLKLVADESLMEECWHGVPMAARDPHTFYQFVLSMAPERPETNTIDIVELAERRGSGENGEWTWRWINEAPVEYWRSQPPAVRKFLGEQVQQIGEGPYVHNDKLYIFARGPVIELYVDFGKVLVCGLGEEKSLEVLDTLPDTAITAAAAAAAVGLDEAAGIASLTLEGGSSQGEAGVKSPPAGFPPYRIDFASVVMDGYLYVLGGVSVGEGYVPLADVWRLSLLTGDGNSAGAMTSSGQLRWEKLDVSLQIPVYQASALHHDGSIFLFGGITSSGWRCSGHEISDQLQQIHIPK